MGWFTKKTELTSWYRTDKELKQRQKEHKESGLDKTRNISYQKLPEESGYEGTNSCSHNWKFDHKGADAKYPRYWYKCGKCNASGVAENSGDTIREQ